MSEPEVEPLNVVAPDSDGPYIDEELFSFLRDKRRDALSEISDFNPFVNQTFDKTTLYEKVKVGAFPPSLFSPQ